MKILSEYTGHKSNKIIKYCPECTALLEIDNNDISNAYYGDVLCYGVECPVCGEIIKFFRWESDPE